MHKGRDFEKKCVEEGFFLFYDCTLKTNPNYSIDCSPVVWARSYYITPLWFYPLHSLHPARDRFCLLWFPVWWLQQNPLLITLTVSFGLVKAPRTEPANHSWPYHKEANRNLCILVPLRSGSFSSFISASICPSRIPSSEDLFYYKSTLY